jgi:hypothetical protein
MATIAISDLHPVGSDVFTDQVKLSLGFIDG